MATWIQMVVAVAFCWATFTCAAAIAAGHVGGGGGTGIAQVFSSASRASVYCCRRNMAVLYLIRDWLYTLIA